MSFFTRDVYTGRPTRRRVEDVVLKPVLTGVGVAATNTFEVTAVADAAFPIARVLDRAVTYGANSTQSHSHFSVMGQPGVPDEAVLRALQASAEPDTFPYSMPVTAVQAMGLTTSANENKEWNLMSWGGRRGSTLWHASLAETPNSVTPAQRRTGF